jgi:hypothetical protein
MAYVSKSEGTAMMDANYQYPVGLSILGGKDQAFEYLREAVKLRIREHESIDHR